MVDASFLHHLVFLRIIGVKLHHIAIKVRYHPFTDIFAHFLDDAYCKDFPFCSPLALKSNDKWAFVSSENIIVRRGLLRPDNLLELRNFLSFRPRVHPTAVVPDNFRLKAERLLHTSFFS